MELDELQCQDQIRQELVTAENKYNNLKKDFDKLSVEHSQVNIVTQELECGGFFEDISFSRICSSRFCRTSLETELT